METARHLEICANVDNSRSVVVPFVELVGALIYLTRTTRPDISFAVYFLARFTHLYDEKEWKAAKTLLKYFPGMKKFGLLYYGGKFLYGYTDSDWRGDLLTKNLGGLFVLHGSSNLLLES